MFAKYCLFVRYVSIILLIFIIGCDKDTGPTAPTDNIPANLFPLEVGRYWIFDIKETDTLGNLIPGRSGTDVMKVTRSLVLSGRQCYEVVDTVKISDTIDVEKNYFYIDDKGNVWQYLGSEDNDTVSGGYGWLKTFNRELGFDKTHLVLDTSFYIQNIPARLRITSVIKRKVTITVPIGQFNEAYPAELEIQISVGLYSVVYKINVWLVPNVGFVKFRETRSPDFGQPVTGYRIKELRNKNF